jgi:transposase
MKRYSAMGVDVSDKNMKVVGLDADGNIAWRQEVACRECAVKTVFGKIAPCVVALETGGHAGWLARALMGVGHEVVVANARKVRAISANERKSDWIDAEILARLVRSDRMLLHPVTLRSAQTQADMVILKARDAAVRARALMVNAARSFVKGTGERIRKCSTAAFAKRCREDIKSEALLILEPLLAGIEAQTEVIRAYDRKIATTAQSARYEQGVNQMTQITGVGVQTALAYVLSLEAPERFADPRQVGPFLGLTPRRDQSGDVDKQLGITHAGNTMMRRLLVGSAQHIMGPFGPDCDLRRFGERLAARGGKSAKKRAVVAVARKLGVLMMKLWQSGRTYEPLHSSNGVGQAA